MRVRESGNSGPSVVLVHGGPGAPGYLAPVARELADSFRVLEPFQRGSDVEPLTVARHVEDLHDLLASRGDPEPPAVIGHSWGAMLALAHAAEYPEDLRSLVLIGCGTFDEASRRRLTETRDARMGVDLRRRIEQLHLEVPDPDERLRMTGELILPAYSFDLASRELELDACDARAHHESWDDMMRLQNEDVYPSAFASIRVPVLMLHGAHDPHPGAWIRASLEPYVLQLEYREWERCGHYPWLERSSREELFAVLRDWAARP